MSTGGPASVTRDEDTVTLWTEFLDEAIDHVTRTDTILLQAPPAGVPADQVNAVFRAFHSIKGLAGFCNLDQVQSLAHRTETVLNLVRDGTHVLSGDLLELMLDSTGVMSALLEEVRRALSTSTHLETLPDVAAVLERLEALGAAAPKSSGSKAAAKPASLSGAYAAVAPAPTSSPSSSSASKPAAKSAPPAAAEPKAARVRETLRVDVERVERLVDMIGELVIVQSMLGASADVLATGSPMVRRQLGQLSKISREIQDAAMRMRMIPIRDAFQRMTRALRDLTQKTGKAITLTTSGDSTEMDRSVVEKLEDPLLHMIRNSVDHGIESSPERITKGKPKQGTIHLSAKCEGSTIVLEIRDDGRGLSRQKIMTKALERGLSATPEMSDEEIFGLIFLPGFSTATQVTDLSGRGVGMDVVRKSVEAMHGRISIESVEGKGTTFRLFLPLTTAIIDGLLVQSGNERYVVPSLGVRESLVIDPSKLVRRGQDELIGLRGALVPVVRLANVFRQPPSPNASLAIIVEGLGRKLAVVVDDVIGQLQVVIKTLSTESLYFSGAAILPDGKVGLILDPDRVARRLLGAHLPAASQLTAAEALS